MFSVSQLECKFRECRDCPSVHGCTPRAQDRTWRTHSSLNQREAPSSPHVIEAETEGPGEPCSRHPESQGHEPGIPGPQDRPNLKCQPGVSTRPTPWSEVIYSFSFNVSTYCGVDVSGSLGTWDTVGLQQIDAQPCRAPNSNSPPPQLSNFPSGRPATIWRLLENFFFFLLGGKLQVIKGCSRPAGHHFLFRRKNHLSFGT